MPTVARSNYQLIGIAAPLIAAKFEESVSGMVPNLVYLTDSAYTIEDTLRTEIRILKTIEFNLGRPLPLYFLRNYSTAANFAHNNFVSILFFIKKRLCLLFSPCIWISAQRRLWHAGKVFARAILGLQVFPVPYIKVGQYLPSMLAAAALCLSLK